MSIVNNQLITKSWSSVTAENISDVWDFFEDAFTGFDGVTFLRNTESTEMYVYLDPDKKMKIKISLVDNTSGIHVEYYLKAEKCSYEYSQASNVTARAEYIRTSYGVAWVIKTATSTISINDVTCFFTLVSTPTLILDAITTLGGSTKSHYVLSAIHDSIESIAENQSYISNILGGQKFWVTNACSLVKDLRLRHMFRVIGIPSNSYPLGNIRVNGRNIIWFGRFALEFEEE